MNHLVTLDRQILFVLQLLQYFPDLEVYHVYNDTNDFLIEFPVSDSFGTNAGQLDLDPTDGVRVST